MARVFLDNVTKYYGNVLAVNKLTLECKHKEFFAILGPSGCGKSSTMRMIAGLEEISSGEIYLDKKIVSKLPPALRNVAMAFESYALYPHMTVFDNITYPLRVSGLSDSEQVERAINIAKMIHIDEFLDKRPIELSGGVQQRVSLARALVRKPSVFLLDEPISHLDADLRSDMRSELKRLHLINDATTIYVTHDQSEALTMADTIAVMNDGILQQVGTPEEIYKRPVNRFVATFVGEPPMNIFKGYIKSESNFSKLIIEELELSQINESFINKFFKTDNFIEVGFRPDDFELTSNDSTLGIVGKVRVREVLGDSLILTIDTKDHRLRIRSNRETKVLEGETIKLKPKVNKAHFFDPNTTLRIDVT